MFEDGIKNTTVGVYLLTNDNTGEVYAGSGYLAKRAKDHYYSLAAGKHKNARLQEAYNRDPNFQFHPVEVPDRDEAFDIEQAIIDEHKDNPLFLNMCTNARSGAAPGRRHSEETKEKIRRANTGRIVPEEEKQRMREAQLRRDRTNESVAHLHTPQAIEKRRQKQIGHEVTPETREKMRQALTGKKRTPEQCERIRQGQLSKAPLTEEARANMSAAQMGRTHTDDVKRKMSTSISVGDKVYGSIGAAAEGEGLTYPQASYRLQTNPNWSYVDGKRPYTRK